MKENFEIKPFKKMQLFDKLIDVAFEDYSILISKFDEDSGAYILKSVFPLEYVRNNVIQLLIL